jgi:acyl-CoA thioester hydrolase
MDVRIRYRDTDCTGRIFFSRYFEYFDDAVVEFLREKGVASTSLGGFVLEDSRKGEAPVIGDAHCRFMEETFFDDMLEVRTQVDTVGEKKIVFRFTCYNKTRERVCAQGYMTLIYIDLETRTSAPLPESLLQKLRGS